MGRLSWEFPLFSKLRERERESLRSLIYGPPFNVEVENQGPRRIFFHDMAIEFKFRSKQGNSTRRFAIISLMLSGNHPGAVASFILPTTWSAAEDLRDLDW